MDLVHDDLQLREPVLADVTRVVDAVQSSRRELAPWMPWATPDYDVETAKSWINGVFGDAYRFVMIDRRGELVGSCGLNALDEVNRRANLGYWVRSDQAGRGLATIATNLLARHGLGSVGLHRLEIVMSTRNEASQRVAEKAGAHHEGVARGRLLLLGEHHDAHMYSLVAGDLRDR